MPSSKVPKRLPLAFLLAFSLCRGALAQDPVIDKIKAPDGSAEVIFFGVEDETLPEAVITGLQIKDIAENKIYTFSPSDRDSLDLNGFYKAVWSPSGKYLVLPVGRFDGFLIVNFNEFRKDVKARGTILCTSLTDRYLAHFFDKWTPHDEFTFYAGLENEFVKIRFDLIKKLRRPSIRNYFRICSSRKRKSSSEPT